MRSKNVTLGGKEYRIDQLPMKQNREWRMRLGEPVGQLMTLLSGFQSPQLDKTADWVSLIGLAKELLLGSMDLLLEALFAYAPTLAADREQIEEAAYDDEALAALGVAVSLAYPLDQALGVLRLGGLPVTPTSMSLPSANGASGTKLGTAGPRRSTTRT